MAEISLGYMPTLAGGCSHDVPICSHDVPSCIGQRFVRFLDIGNEEKMINTIIMLLCSNEERANTIRTLQKEIDSLKPHNPPPYKNPKRIRKKRILA